MEDPKQLAGRYGVTVFWSDEDETYIAVCPSFPGHSAHGETVDEAAEEGMAALELMIESYLDHGDPLPSPPKPLTDYSGKLNLRMPRSLHARLAQEAETEGVSLNTLILTKLAG